MHKWSKYKNTYLGILLIEIALWIWELGIEKKCSNIFVSLLTSISLSLSFFFFEIQFVSKKAKKRELMWYGLFGSSFSGGWDDFWDICFFCPREPCHHRSRVCGCVCVCVCV